MKLGWTNKDLHDQDEDDELEAFSEDGNGDSLIASPKSITRPIIQPPQ